MATSAELGVIHSGADDKWRLPIREFGEKIGVAFQLIDDVIDLYPPAANSGKTAGTDLRAQVPTLPVLLLRKQALTDQAAATLLAEIDGDLSSDESLASVVAKLRNHQVTAQANELARQWAKEAIEAVSVLPAGSIKNAFASFAEAVVERER